jgi:predicted metal-dependent hydrolase
VDWLKGEAARELKLRSAYHAARLGVEVRSITMRDQASRWGSCSSRGSLNYNWRLILAPPFVLDYVAAHEVAHLVEMNHSAAFWATVKRTLPDMERGRAWLKAHGRELMAFRAD